MYDFGIVVKKSEDFYYAGCKTAELKQGMEENYSLGYAVIKDSPNRHIDFDKVVEYYNSNPDKAYEYVDFHNRGTLAGYAKTCYAEMARLDFIGIKIAMGRATIEEYQSDIEYQERNSHIVDLIKKRLSDKIPVTDIEVEKIINGIDPNDSSQE